MRAWPLIAYAALYGTCLALLVGLEGLSPAEPLLVLAIFGVGFSGLAWWSTRGLTPRAAPVRSPAREGPAVLGYLALLTLCITWGLPALRAAVPAGWPAELAVLIAKVGVFVGAPLVLWRRFGYARGEMFAFRDGLTGHWRPVVVLGAAIVLFQAVLGRAHTELPAMHLTGAVVLWFVAGFAWLVVDVGLVEELWFRGFLQTRLAAWSGSEALGLVTMALLFGLAHAPGLYLRPELTGEAVGGHPSLLLAVCYSVTYTSVSGLFLGVLWLRTRNPWVVMLVHAAQDWLPTVLDALRTGVLGG